MMIKLTTLLMIWFLWWPQPAIASTETIADTQNTEMIHHVVSTNNALAQTLFDRGLQSFFAYDLEAAEHLFQQAIEQDAELAMAYWGLAIASSPDINQPIDLHQEAQAYEIAQRALALVKNPHTSRQEKDYIDALQERYSLNPNVDLKKLMEHHCDHLAKLMQKYPDDPDVATLYVEGLMDLQEWNFWGESNEPLSKTLEIVSTLESVLKDHPNHLGANHYYVHVMEGSLKPELALIHAKRLLPYVETSEHLREFIGYVLSM